MRVFLNRSFQRFCVKAKISEEALSEAIERAEQGLIDADLGGGVIKQRIPRPNEGRSGGFRSVVIYRTNERSFFVHGFAKNDTENISASELKDLKELGRILLSASETEITSLVDQGKLKEVKYGRQDL